MIDIVPGSEHAVGILRADHGHIKNLLSRLQIVDRTEQENVLSDLFLDLRIHSVLEQQLFYPSVSKLLGREKIAESGKDFYVMLALMLELESFIRTKEPLTRTLQDLSDRFQQHVNKDEGLFHQLDDWSAKVPHCNGSVPEWCNLTTSLADKMQSYRAELKQKLARKQGDTEANNDVVFRARPRRPRCA